jgi:D-amino-acid dehydrogenase
MTDPAHARPGETVLILGAGVVGCAAALTFARAGFAVTVVDRDAPGSGCSHGNAGGIVPQAAPLARPGVPMETPRLLMDRHGPLGIRPRRVVEAFPWYLRFLQDCLPGPAERHSRALYDLTGRAVPAWKALLRGTPGADLMRDVGWLKVFDTDSGFAAHASERAFLVARGAPLEILNEDELRQLEPNLDRRFKHAVLQPDASFVTNPRRLVEALADEARGLGVVFERYAVRDAGVGADARPRLRTDAGILSADRLMICAGAFSAPIAARFGAAPRLEAERGYHAMLATPTRSLARPTVWPEAGIVLSPMETGIRLATQAEFAGLSPPPDYTRLDRMTRRAGEMLPGLDTTPLERWMGHRPSTPDSLPYLGRAPDFGRVYYNFGHNHLGLTLAAVSARQALDDWTGAATRMTPHPYRACR